MTTLGVLSDVHGNAVALDDGTRVLGVHASPGRDDGDGITPDRPESILTVELAGAGADVVIAGHTHRPTDRFAGGVRAVNAGSVGNPVTEDLRASYVIVRSTIAATRSSRAASRTTATRSSAASRAPVTRRVTTSPRSSMASRSGVRSPTEHAALSIAMRN